MFSYEEKGKRAKAVGRFAGKVQNRPHQRRGCSPQSNRPGCRACTHCFGANDLRPGLPSLRGRICFGSCTSARLARIIWPTTPQSKSISSAARLAAKKRAAAKERGERGG